MRKTLFAALVILPCVLSAQTTAKPAIHVTLLGTGTPIINVQAYVAQSRANAGLLIEAGTERLLFDCGQGVVTRLIQSGGADPVNNPNVAVDKVFISHLHSDHMVDLPALYSYGWLFRYNDPLHVWGPGPGPNGPFGISSVMPLLRLVFDTDIYIRSSTFVDLAFPMSGEAPLVDELQQGVVYQNNGVTVTAFLVDHHPVTPAYGFRVDYAGHSVVFSGDTQYSPNLVKYATGADVIIHEIWGWTLADGGSELYSYHTNPADWARVMLSTGPKMAVMTHIGLQPPGYPDLPNGTSPTDLVNQVRAGGYKGPLTVGLDLMTIDVADSGVTVTNPPGGSAVPLNESQGGVPPELRELLKKRGGPINH